MKRMSKIALLLAVASMFIACGGGSSSEDTKVFKLDTKTLNNQVISAENAGGLKLDFSFYDDGSYSVTPDMGFTTSKWSVAGDDRLSLSYKASDGAEKSMDAVFKDVDKNGKLNVGDSVSAHGQIATISKIEKTTKPVVGDSTVVSKDDSKTDKPNGEFVLKASDLVKKKIIIMENMAELDFVSETEFRLAPWYKTKPKYKGTWKIADKNKVVVTYGNGDTDTYIFTGLDKDSKVTAKDTMADGEYSIVKIVAL